MIGTVPSLTVNRQYYYCRLYHQWYHKFIIMSLINKKYLHYLSTHPLLTKSITAAILASLNELIASIIAQEFKLTTLNLPIPFSSFTASASSQRRRELVVKFLNPYNFKIPLLATFAFLVQAPFAHYAYKFLNQIKYFQKQPLSLVRKFLQIVVSLTTITPVVCTLNVAYLGLINNQELVSTVADGITKFENFKELSHGLLGLFIPSSSKVVSSEAKAKFKQGIIDKLQFVWGIIKTSLDKNLVNFLKSSWVSSPLIMLFAQTYLDPNSWVVFFNFAYFVLGTFQNTLMKLKLKQLKRKQKLEKEAREESEKEKQS